MYSVVIVVVVEVVVQYICVFLGLYLISLELKQRLEDQQSTSCMSYG